MRVVSRGSYLGYPLFDYGLPWGHFRGEDELVWGGSRNEHGLTRSSPGYPCFDAGCGIICVGDSGCSQCLMTGGTWRTHELRP